MGTGHSLVVKWSHRLKFIAHLDRVYHSKMTYVLQSPHAKVRHAIIILINV